MKEQKPWQKTQNMLNLHTGVKWQEMLPPFNGGGLSLTSAALFVSQRSGKA